eukprot:1108125-Rhodomonas_salina.1
MQQAAEVVEEALKLTVVTPVLITERIKRLKHCTRRHRNTVMYAAKILLCHAPQEPRRVGETDELF